MSLLFPSILLVLTAAQWQPEQIHIALGSTPDQLSFGWLTWDSPVVTQSIVKVGETPTTDGLTLNATGNTTLFVDCGSEKTERTIHTVIISNLKPLTQYYYQVGDPKYGWSPIYTFITRNDANTIKNKDNLLERYLIFGDLGVQDGICLPDMQEKVLNGNYDVLIHLGDFAYNFYEENGTRGDNFMKAIEPISSRIQYMVTPGNHEAAYNFSHYSQRFRGQPENTEYPIVWTESGPTPNNWFFSWNNGLVHWISVSTEIYFDFPYMISDQYNWLDQDLTKANNNRTNAPWIIVYGHKPLYCSDDVGDCGSNAELVRNGPKNEMGLESLFYKHGVDFYFCGHNHDYERMYDIYQSSTTHATTNMAATTYIVSGSAGNREGHDGFSKTQPTWSAFRSTDYSYTEWNVINSTHIQLKQYSVDESQYIDTVTYIQTNHGPFRNKAKALLNNNNEFTQITLPNKRNVPYHVNPKISEPIIEYISDNKHDYKGIHGVFF